MPLIKNKPMVLANFANPANSSDHFSKNSLNSKSAMLNEPLKDGSLTFQSTEWLTTDEVASIYKLPKQSVRNMTSNGSLPVYKLGNRNRYSRADIDSILLKSKRG